MGKGHKTAFTLLITDHQKDPLIRDHQTDSLIKDHQKMCRSEQ